MPRQSTVILFSFSALASASYVLTRALAISLFLARIGPASLPGALAVAATAVTGVSFLTQSLMRRRSTARSASVSWLILGTASGILAFTIGPHHHSAWVLGGLYVLAEIRACLGTIYAVSLASETFSGVGSKTPFAVVSSGAPIAGTLVGLALGFEASIAQAAAILLIVAALDIVTAGLSWWSRRRLPGAPAVEGAPADEEQPVVPRPLFRGYRFDLSWLVALQVVALTLITFQWQVAVAERYGFDEAALVAYFAFFFAASDILIVLIQWLASGRLLDRFGLRVGLVGLPILAALVGLVAFLSSSDIAMFLVLTVAKGLTVLRRSIHDPALTAAYAVIHPDVRRQTIVVVKGVIKPVAEAATAIALLVSGVSLLSNGLTIAWIGAVGLWACFALRVSRTYRSTAEAEGGVA